MIEYTVYAIATRFTEAISTQSILPMVMVTDMRGAVSVRLPRCRSYRKAEETFGAIDFGNGSDMDTEVVKASPKFKCLKNVEKIKSISNHLPPPPPPHGQNESERNEWLL